MTDTTSILFGLDSFTVVDVVRVADVVSATRRVPDFEQALRAHPSS